MMTAVLERRYSPASEWARRLGAFSVVLFLTSALAHRFGFLEVVPFLWVLALCGMLAFAGICLAITGFIHFWERGLEGLSSAAIGGILCAFVLAPYAVSAYRLVTNPQLVDVSTDISRPPRFVRAGHLRVPPMNELALAHDLGAELRAKAVNMPSGRRYEQTIQNVTEVVSTLIADRGWEFLSPKPAADVAGSVTMELVARSYLLAFPSDVAIRIEDRSDATYVDMRSASRYGRHDLGENRVRIERFLDDLDTRLEALSDL